MILTGNVGYIFATAGFVFGMILMNKPENAKKGNLLMVFSMVAAIVSTVFIYTNSELDDVWKNWLLILLLILSGIVIGRRLSFAYELTRMPELVSLFNGLGGLAAALISIVGLMSTVGNLSEAQKLLLLGSYALGLITFTGSTVAFFKLSGKLGKSLYKNEAFTLLTLVFCLIFFGQSLLVNSSEDLILNITLLGLFSLLFGIFFANGVGGADMPVLISILNGVTGIVTTVTGVYFENTIMILLGIFVGFTGIVLTAQMSKAMNRSLIKVFFPRSHKKVQDSAAMNYENIREITASSIAGELMYCRKVALVPGFGLAVAQAQKTCQELMLKLNEMNIDVKFIIHPVAGRMPGHMNVLLAEANIGYEDILDMEEGNLFLTESDYCFIVGANDIVNVSAENDENSSIHGMPIIQAYKAKKVVVIKRSLGSGYAGIPNPLFEYDNCELFLSDAKLGLNDVVDNLKSI